MGHQDRATLEQELPPLVGIRLLIVSHGLERAFQRARGLDDMGYRVTACDVPARADHFIAEFEPEAVIVDLGREVTAPQDVIWQIRMATDAPLLAVGSTGEISEMARCLESGADDYCNPRATTQEADLRLRAIFRRMQRVQTVAVNHASVMQVGELEIDTAGRLVRKRGEIVPLSPTEFRLLVTLAEHAGEVVPSKALIARVWGNQYEGETHYLRLYVRYLRQKLEDDPSEPRYIVNRWGAGYALEAPPKAA